MDSWLAIVIRQIILYSLPVVVSLTLVGMAESRWLKRKPPHAFYPIAWSGTWLPSLAAILFTRGVIFALPQPMQAGPAMALLRLGAHLVLALIGFLLYTWSLQHMGVSGLPPLHHWWAKVLMYFNLCMIALHLLPLPGMVVGEWLATTSYGSRVAAWLDPQKAMWAWILLAASPLLDWSIGGWLIFPAYEELARAATYL